MMKVAKKMAVTATRATRTPLRNFSPELASSRKGLNSLLLILLIVVSGKKENAAWQGWPAPPPTIWRCSAQLITELFALSKPL